MDNEIRQDLVKPVPTPEQRYQTLTDSYVRLTNNYEQLCHSIGLTNELLFELLEKLGGERCSDFGARARPYRNIPPSPLRRLHRPER